MQISAFQLYLISYYNQNLSRQILKASTVWAETNESGKLFYTEIILFVKLNFTHVKLYRKLIYAESVTS